jgi:NTE family protein
MKKIGLAFGSGGVRGIAHIFAVEAFEELGIKPAVIAGSSMGAIIGTAYAAGLTSKEMKSAIEHFTSGKNLGFWDTQKLSDFRKLIEFLDPTMKLTGFIKGDKFLNTFERLIGTNSFSDLKIPLKIVATNYLERKEVIFEKGDLIQAVRASYSVPGLFSPVSFNNTLLVDGGMVNPLPYDILKSDSDITVAVDVSSPKSNKKDEIPVVTDAVFTAFQIMQNSILESKLAHSRPNILIRTEIKDIRLMEFLKSRKILAEHTHLKDEIKRRLAKLLDK